MVQLLRLYFSLLLKNNFYEKTKEIPAVYSLFDFRYAAVLHLSGQ